MLSCVNLDTALSLYHPTLSIRRALLTYISHYELQFIMSDKGKLITSDGMIEYMKLKGTDKEIFETIILRTCPE